MSWPQFWHDFRISWPRFSPGSTTIDHDHGLIVRRLGVDLAADLHENISDDRGVDSASNAPRLRLDRAAIAVRSDRDRGVLPHVFSAVRYESDVPDLLRKEKKIGRRVAIRSRSCGLNFDGDGLSSCRHVAIGEPSDRSHLNRHFPHVMHLMIAWTWVHTISAIIDESNAHRAATRPA